MALRVARLHAHSITHTHTRARGDLLVRREQLKQNHMDATCYFFCLVLSVFSQLLLLLLFRFAPHTLTQPQDVLRIQITAKMFGQTARQALVTLFAGLSAWRDCTQHHHHHTPTVREDSSMPMAFVCGTCTSARLDRSMRMDAHAPTI